MDTQIRKPEETPKGLEVLFVGRANHGLMSAASIVTAATQKVGWASVMAPDFGAAKMGAPVRFLVRNTKVWRGNYCPPLLPDVLIVSTVSLIDILPETSPDAIFLVNTDRSPEEVAKLLGPYRVYTVNANRISVEEQHALSPGRDIGTIMPYPNMPLLGALLPILTFLNSEDVEAIMEEMFAEKAPKVRQGNLKALRRGKDEVRLFDGRGQDIPQRVVKKPLIPVWRETPLGCIVTKTSEDVDKSGWRTKRPAFVGADDKPFRNADGSLVDMPTDRCMSCLLCAKWCPDLAILVSDDGSRGGFIWKACTGCGVCAELCPAGALTMVEETTECKS